MAHVPIRIPLEPLVSSNISAGGYDTDKKILAVQFKSGPIFHYAGVPLQVATEFYCAESKGRYYRERIQGQYSGEKMTGRCACGGHGWIGDTCEECKGVFEAEPYTPKEGRANEGTSGGRRLRSAPGDRGGRGRTTRATVPPLGAHD